MLHPRPLENLTLDQTMWTPFVLMSLVLVSFPLDGVAVHSLRVDLGY